MNWAHTHNVRNFSLSDGNIGDSGKDYKLLPERAGVRRSDLYLLTSKKHYYWYEYGQKLNAPRILLMGLVACAIVTMLRENGIDSNEIVLAAAPCQSVERPSRIAIQRQNFKFRKFFSIRIWMNRWEILWYFILQILYFIKILIILTKSHSKIYYIKYAPRTWQNFSVSSESNRVKPIPNNVNSKANSI